MDATARAAESPSKRFKSSNDNFGGDPRRRTRTRVALSPVSITTSTRNAPDDKKVYSVVVDFITPESDTSMWYFWGMARKFKPNDPALTHSIREGQGKIFAEDLEMLEKQQRNLSDHPTRDLLKLNIDAGGVQSRRVIERLLAQEQGASV